MSDLQPELLAWTALLGRWIDLVKAGAGMPEAGDGDHWQKSIPSIIELQATAFALGDLESLESADRPLARDRATLLVEAIDLDTLTEGRDFHGGSSATPLQGPRKDRPRWFLARKAGLIWRPGFRQPRSSQGQSVSDPAPRLFPSVPQSS